MEPAATTKTTGIYCKTCGYDLRASGEAGRCPECGRGFSPGDSTTFRKRPFAAPWKRALGRWAKRAAILLLVLGILLGGPWGWYYWGWKEEQAVLAQVEGDDMAPVPDQVILGGAPGRWLCDHRVPGSFVLVRLRQVCLPKYNMPADLRPLQKLSELEVLEVDAPITDAGLAQLRHCPRLRSLMLQKPRITAAGLLALRDLPRLQFLALFHAVLTDAALAGLDAATPLDSLFLDFTPLTDADLVHLAPLGSLRCLSLKYTRVTDASLVQLEKFTGLKRLDLRDTKVTPAGVARLRAALPRCTIVGP